MSKIKKPYKVLVGLLLLIYIVCVLYITVIDRRTHLKIDYNFDLFWSYRKAWDTYSLNGWYYVIGNITMCVPLGFLLPMLHKWYRNLFHIVITGFTFSSLIEIIQLVAKRGLCELDDVVNNVLGTIIGWGVIMFIISVKEHNVDGKTPWYLFPLIVALIFFINRLVW